MTKVIGLTIDLSENEKISFSDNNELIDIKISNSNGTTNVSMSKNQLELVYKFFHVEDIKQEVKNGTDD